MQIFSGAAVGIGLACLPLRAEVTLIIQPVAEPEAADAKLAPAVPQKEEKPPQKAKKPKAPAVKDGKPDAYAPQAPVRRRVPAPTGFAKAAAANALEQQMRKQLEPTLKAELSFAVRAAALDANERRSLIAAGKTWFDKYIADAAKNQDPNRQQMLMQGGQAIWFGGRGPQTTNPRNEIRKGLAKIAASSFSKEKAEAYAGECRKRDDFYRQVSVENLIVRIDDKVILSPEQRKVISDSLTTHWDQIDKPQIEAFAISASMWPGVPNDRVLPALTAAQQAVLKRLNSVTGRVFFGNGMFGEQGAVLDDIDLNEPAGDTEKSGPAGADAKAP